MPGKRPSQAKTLAEHTPKFGPYSKRHGRLSRRYRIGRVEEQIKRELTAHVGGKPSAPQRLLIERVARLYVQLDMLDKQLVTTGGAGDLAARQLIAFTNTMRLLLVALGIEAPKAEAPSLAEYLERRKSGNVVSLER